MPRSAVTALLTSPWFLVAVVWLAFFWQLGAVPLYDLDEGAFTEATREMLDSGNFITPHRDGEPRYDKPVLIYWLQAASVSVLGLNEFALRLPSAIAATAWLLALWGFVRQRLDVTTATVAGLVMALALQVSIIAKGAVADALLNLFIALAFFDIYRYRLKPARGTLLRVYLWLGLGFLTKGPVAVFFPLVVSLLYFASCRDLRTWGRAVFAPLGWLVFLAVAGPWYLAILLDDGVGFFRSFFLDHNLGRYGGVKHGHAGFPGYYLVMLPVVLLPFTGWFLRLLPAGRRLWADALDRFLVLWFVTVFVFFSFSDTKLPHYLVYGITPLFILMARHRALLVNRWLALLPPMLFMALLVALPDLLPLFQAQAERLHEQALFATGSQVLDARYRVATWLGLLALLGLLLWRRPPPWERLVLAGVIQSLVVFGVLVPRVFQVMQAPVKEAALVARELDLPTVVYQTSMPSFSVYRQAITPQVAMPQPGQLVFLRIDKLERLERQVAQSGGVQLLQRYRRGPVALVQVVVDNGG
ncbi:glycosyltransferase family 39 protein [Thiohalocapsa marina]|uniref:Glycosyltransferase family 39 protein n=1 Tax=Thiohalocapsa marina TaxID=424902 RepID=A0A5M8FJJ6_9GAMM|nr:glycosyltransferase family 39 protein [Thiohalocapsa marina]KAA6184150.1 glycosyltransferase family 39 protein [Thiohalocapsa marina]